MNTYRIIKHYQVTGYRQEYVDVLANSEEEADEKSDDMDFEDYYDGTENEFMETTIEILERDVNE